MKDKNKNSITIKKEDLMPKIRTGVIHTKIVPDKTKYSRKREKAKKESFD